MINSGKFINEDANQQQAYTNAIATAEALKNNSQNPELDKANIEQAINNINSAINNLNGEAKLTKAKEDAVASINNLRGLTNEQKLKKIKLLMMQKQEIKLLTFYVIQRH